ncbi:hexose transporter [Mycena galopus ATCC 62051]|nr:hexose transporter [Mycena galopus ATCC 62051]
MAGEATNGTSAYTHLMDRNRTWYNNRRLITLNAWIALLLLTSTASGYDSSMMNGLQFLPNWQNYFGDPKNSKLGLLNAIQNVGGLAGLPFAPYLSDGIGRRPTVFIGALIMCIAAAIQTVSQSVGMFIGARCLIGFGLSFAASAAPMLVLELSYPKYRAQLTSTYNSLWCSGAIIAAWATFATFKINSTWAWRLPSLLQAVPSALQVCFVLFIPESPRFLVSKGREAEALKTLAYYHADSNEDDPLVKYEFEEIKAATEFDRSAAANVGWKAFLATPGNRKRVRIIVAIAFFSQWSANGLVSYYLNTILTSIGVVNPTIQVTGSVERSSQLLINGLLQIWNLAWALAASSVVERFGRRLLFLTSVSLMTVFFTMQTICTARFRITGDPSAAHAVIAFIFLYYASYELDTLEILPYNIRAKGFNIFSFTSSLALIFNQYVNPVALDAIDWKYYIVYCVWLLFESVFIFFYLIETKNRTLEETAAIFDGENVTDQIVISAAVQVGASYDDNEKATESSGP